MTLGRWSLDQLLILVGGCLMYAAFLAIGAYVTTSVSALLEQELSAKGRTIARVVSQELLDPLLVEDRLKLHDILRRAAATSNDLRYLCIQDGSGKVLAHTFPKALPTTLRELWQTTRGETIRFNSDQGPILEVAEPLWEGEAGVLRAGFTRSRVVDTTYRLKAGVGIAFFCASIALFWGLRLVANRVRRPLRLLEHQLSSFPQERPTGDSPVTGTKEVQALSQQFVEMTERLDTLEHERTVTQQRLIHTERLAALGELAAGLAHEIHNPLDGMQECLAYLNEDPDVSERALKYYPMLQSGLERIGHTMHQMLGFARSGERFAAEPYPVREMMEALALLVTPRLEGRRIDLTWDLTRTCVCHCDREAFSQAGLNLILNAAEAVEGAPTATIKVRAECDPNSVFMIVEDSGPGVPQELAAKIFEPFYTTRALGKGTGLGLSVSREALRAVGGDLELSESPSSLGGAMFVIRTPRAGCCSSPGSEECCNATA
ncbi:MAG: hypothetical protein HN742_00810 [Lentisphaerae bacterium]|jgi:two-component system, NtrC family, sensor kinase|nr:hypothetical protein [Lentisphaerota bacterium]MBT5606378.1 hypothetical protein [Lentisphaerota bacterium]MBT7056767.1 hypothetical protein [Lentisphaerota bacterium]MBT7840372.1 hypothetical protein [Lentisphaerota bacterium]